MSTLNEKKQILKSIPIAYYLGHPLEVVLDDKTSTSFINLKTKTINIAASQVVDGDLQLTRSSVYHELSHALFTPEDLFDIASAAKRDYINIFEDWRIEKKASDFFIEIDFNRNIFFINKTTKEKELAKPLTAQYYPNFINFFYAVLRYGILKKLYESWLDKIFDFCKTINSSNTAAGSMLSQCFDLVYSELLKFYNKFILQQQQELESLKQRREEQLEDEQQQQQQQQQQESDQPQPSEEASMEELHSIFKNAAIVNNDPLIDRELEKIININSGAASASAAYTYTGANFNVKKYVEGINSNNLQQAFKSFVKSSSNGALKQSKITRLIVIQDISGSYSDNAAVTRGVYRALYDFQKKHSNQFKLEVIASGSDGYDTRYEKARDFEDVNRWLANLEGSSGLDPRLEQYIPVSDPRYDDYFLILFDGRITPAGGYLEDYWRDRKTFVISDDKNTFFKYLKDYKKTNEVLFVQSRNYALYLYENIKKVLNKIR